MNIFSCSSSLRLFSLTLTLGFLASCALFGYPKVSPAPDLKIEVTAEKIERGRYLANNVAVCIDCHSARQWDHFAGPVAPGSEGQGGEKFGREFGFPGDYYAPNITPAAIGQWTDGEILRAFTSGVSRDGRAFFPVMPYPNYGKMAKEDAEAIVTYIRTLKLVEHTVPSSEPAFPMGMILPTIPRDPEFRTTRPDPSEGLTYAEYVTNIASCIDCHSKAIRGKRVEGMEFAGGFEFKTPDGVIRSANITPDKETGIGTWSRATFIARFKEHDPARGPARKLESGELNTPMPWSMYAGMTETDLGAVYDYLMSLKPVSNAVKRND